MFREGGTGELADRRLQVDARAVAERVPGAGERVRDGGQPLRETLRPLPGRRERPRQQRVPRGAGR